MPLITIEHRGPPPRLTGPLKTRAEARLKYGEIVEEMNACEDRDTLEIYLITVGEALIQYEDELEYWWNGDGDFPGLDAEIKRAFGRFAEYY